MEPFQENMDQSPVFMRKLPITPGYGGYIPLRLNRVGSSYNRDTSYCIKKFRDTTQKYKNQLEALRYHVATADKLKEISSKETVLRMIHDYYLRNHPTHIEADHKKKPLQEPPIPGWAGYVPRARVTELGCAVRYHVMAKQSYEDFLNITELHKKGSLKRYQSLMEDKPFNTIRVPPEFCPGFKPKHEYEDSTRRPCGCDSGVKPFNTVHVPPEFSPGFKTKYEHEDSTRRPCECDSGVKPFNTVHVPPEFSPGFKTKYEREDSTRRPCGCDSGVKPFNTVHVPPDFSPGFKTKYEYEDSTRRPCGCDNGVKPFNTVHVPPEFSPGFKTKYEDSTRRPCGGDSGASSFSACQEHY
ncbi:sperm-associated microtubule inner protein 5 isoform X2 [Notamacropus eugenii]|uniref:sperm-associated microtubule inner protein 5 isoform X2 n=1 Tax=Notamacropus eugenii TaxID=9315 RepID=UPI003B6790C0